ncbi:MAG TPA: SpoIID/LytB domain-containing protein [Pyrinomonadaceae bacterium]|nr:SpoIID/LytB domain-containing protein [Pyrinomonadaceae bacterium]
MSRKPMRPSFSRFFVASLLAHSLAFSPAHSRAQDAQTYTRPRRVAPAPAEEAKAPATEAVAIERLNGEPLIRIGLAASTRSVNVSTTGRLLSLTSPGAQPAPLEVARVRVEPRSLPPPTETNQGEGEPARGTETAGGRPAAPKADPRATPSLKPTSSSVVNTTSAKPPAGARPASRSSVAVRGAAVYAAGVAQPIFDARAPVVFASDDEETHPLRFNEKPYRGRLEVFPNTKGTLTVVNVVRLEDYVRGVVPNELSPGGWPQLEALKAQAVAARTYAVGNLGRFASEGFDLTPDTRSQVYGGRATEHPMTDRAVSETRGLVATYAGRPINALYTSTCGGRTEHAEHIFGGDLVPYLRARECAAEPRLVLVPYAVRSTRPLPDIKRAEHATSARDAALLAVHGFPLPSRLDDDWLEDFIPDDDMRVLLGRVALLARQAAPPVSAEATRPAGFATALLLALDGESRGAAMLNSADVAYHLAFRDGDEVPERNRADVAVALRDGHLGLFPDGMLRPRQAMTRARALRAIAHALGARGLLKVQKASARPSDQGALILRPAGGKGKDQSLKVSADAFLFRAFGEGLHQVREVNVVGGEAVAFHVGAAGAVDYLEVRPAASGAASDRFSPFATWAVTLTPGEVLSRLGRAAGGVGTLVDVRVVRRGASGRVLDLEVVGTGGTAHVRGGRVRSALELREQLFVIDRAFDEAGRVARYTFAGRGWGHGVGMCQVGAFGLARAGMTYDKILKNYYTGIQLSKLY